MEFVIRRKFGFREKEERYFLAGENSPKKLQTHYFYCTYKYRAELYKNDFYAPGDVIFRQRYVDVCSCAQRELVV